MSSERQSPWTIDRRSLGLFRIALGLLLLAHEFTHLRHYRGLYSPAGVLPSALLPGSTEIPYFPSLLTWLERLPWGAALFIACATISYLALSVGWMTRLATCASLVAFSTICHRNPYLVIGADELIGSMLLWSCLVSLSDEFSLDAWRVRHRTPAMLIHTTSSRLAEFGMLWQLGIVYFATAWQKTGSTWWSDGSALIRVLGMTSYRLPGAWLLEKLPISVLLWLSPVIVIIEYLLPVLILSWVAQPLLRRIAIGCIAALHLGIACVIQTGLYSVTMLAMIPLLLSSNDWRLIEQWFNRAAGKSVVSVEANVNHAIQRRWWLELIAVVLLAGGLWENWCRSFAIPHGAASGSFISFPWRFTAAAQRWTMFAPNPPMNDPYLAVSAVRRDGSKTTLWNSLSLDAATGPNSLGSHDFLWKLYLQRISLMLSSERQAEGAALRDQLCRYFAELNLSQTGTAVGTSSAHAVDDNVVAVEIWVTLIPTDAWLVPGRKLQTERVSRFDIPTMNENK